MYRRLLTVVLCGSFDFPLVDSERTETPLTIEKPCDGHPVDFNFMVSALS